MNSAITATPPCIRLALSIGDEEVLRNLRTLGDRLYRDSLHRELMVDTPFGKVCELVDIVMEKEECLKKRGSARWAWIAEFEQEMYNDAIDDMDLPLLLLSSEGSASKELFVNRMKEVDRLFAMARARPCFDTVVMLCMVTTAMVKCVLRLQDTVATESRPPPGQSDCDRDSDCDCDSDCDSDCDCEEYNCCEESESD